jgi:hypothetical protein
MDDAERQAISRFLEQMASGHVPSAASPIGETAIQAKRKAKVDYNTMFTTFEEHFAALPDAERNLITYEDVQAGWWRKTARETIRHMCADWGVSDPEATADRVMAHPERYPHVRTWARIFALNMYQYLVVRSSRDRGDLFDLWQMNYVESMDVFLTEELKLPEWYAHVFGASRRVMTWDQFIGQRW